MDNEDGKTLQDLEQADKYVAFPGGIPKKWLNPAFYSFVIVFIGYASWVISGEIREGRKTGTPVLETAESITTHLSAFTVLLTILTIVFCKGLERIMYYLDAKRIAEQERQRAERAEQLLEQERQRAEQERQRAEQERQRAERAEQLLEQAKKNNS
ncbi:hypothetical protein J4G07_01660 [Candidatus Poribacteria bacterium]|nr:hypothetical protein [Candidatus Poribacteria bacterium]